MDIQPRYLSHQTVWRDRGYVFLRHDYTEMHEPVGWREPTPPTYKSDEQQKG